MWKFEHSGLKTLEHHLWTKRGATCALTTHAWEGGPSNKTMFGRNNISGENKSTSVCCIFRPAFGVLRTPNAGPNSHFQHFLCKKAKKKQEICSKFLQKKCFLKFAPKCWLTALFPKKRLLNILIFFYHPMTAASKLLTPSIYPPTVRPWAFAYVFVF